jgi:hypothetical protein
MNPEVARTASESAETEGLGFEIGVEFGESHDTAEEGIRCEDFPPLYFPLGYFNVSLLSRPNFSQSQDSSKWNEIGLGRLSCPGPSQSRVSSLERNLLAMTQEDSGEYLIYLGA